MATNSFVQFCESFIHLKHIMILRFYFFAFFVITLCIINLFITLQFESQSISYLHTLYCIKTAKKKGIISKINVISCSRSHQPFTYLFSLTFFLAFALNLQKITCCVIATCTFNKYSVFSLFWPYDHKKKEKETNNKIV